MPPLCAVGRTSAGAWSTFLLHRDADDPATIFGGLRCSHARRSDKVLYCIAWKRH